MIKVFSWKDQLRKRVIADRKRVRKETLREVLENIYARMQEGYEDEFNAGYEAALKELYIETALMLRRVDQK